MKDQDMIVVTRQTTSGWKHFQARFSEWLNAAMLFAWGLYLNANPEIMSSPTGSGVFSGFLKVMAAPSWAMVGVLVGGVRLAALYVNGHHRRTPLIRLVTAFFSAFVFTQITIAFFNAEAPNFGVVVYSFLVASDIYSAFRASADMTFVAHVVENGDVSEEGRVGKPA